MLAENFPLYMYFLILHWCFSMDTLSLVLLRTGEEKVSLLTASTKLPSLFESSYTARQDTAHKYSFVFRLEGNISFAQCQDF